jgi:hypothetical protein
MGHVAGRYVKKEKAYRVMWGSLKETDYLKDLGINRKKEMILKLILKSWVHLAQNRK